MCKDYELYIKTGCSNIGVPYSDNNYIYPEATEWIGHG